MRGSLWSPPLYAKSDHRQSASVCFLRHCTLSLGVHSADIQLVFQVVFSEGRCGQRKRAHTNTHTQEHTCPNTHFSSRRSPAVLPVCAGWSFPRNLMLACSSPVGKSYVCVFPGNCPPVSWFLGTTETGHLFIRIENLCNLQKPFFRVPHFHFASITS